tara:strand:+ start:107 stop:385 length:279 start_codon:yes stop_codon:yes gene_type:complete
LGRKSIRIAEDDHVEEVTITFKREESGLFRKILNYSLRDRTSGATLKKLREEDTNQLYEQTGDKEYDHSIRLQDFDGEDILIKLKLVKQADD